VKRCGTNVIRKHGTHPAPMVPIGYLTHVGGPGTPAQALRTTVDLAVAAEELGFASFWVAQHHGGALDGVLPSPLVLLAAVAERTSVIRLGTAVVTAGLEDPVRLAEDAAVLDALCGGRLELGVGAGADAGASEWFGRDHALRHDDCAAAVDELCDLLTGTRLVPGAPGLRERLWWATGSSSGVLAAAGRGMGVLSGRPGVGSAAHLERYWTRAVAEPRAAACRIFREEDDPAGFWGSWFEDPVRPWASELIVQTHSSSAGFEAELRTMRELGPRARSRGTVGKHHALAASVAPDRDLVQS
jgi:alkanesulfonate monooxygenase SsuD/methylene tetrahydromethanopterin reductase-like flavin-dependent oxidoreductase (luciferase family)